MSQIQQLIFTSAPMGLDPGRSGYCTVARSQNLSKREIREIEKLSVLDYSISKISPPDIHSFRLIETKNSFFFLLSRIKSCGIDYSNRTNYIAHHLIISPEIINELPPPSRIFEYWSGWKDKWDSRPKYLHEDIFLELSKLNIDKQKESDLWDIWTGDKKNSKIPLTGHSIFRTQKNDENRLLKLFSESCTNLESIDKSWNYTFTTFLQPTDESVDFVWIGGWKNTSADKIEITSEIHFFDLDKFDESQTDEINSIENPTDFEIKDTTNSKIEKTTVDEQTETKNELEFDKSSLSEDIEKIEFIDTKQVTSSELKTLKAENDEKWKPVQEKPVYKPADSRPTEKVSIQKQEPEINFTQDKKPQKSHTKLSTTSRKTLKPKITAEEKKSSLNVHPPKQSLILTIPFFIVIIVLFCVIFFLSGKLNTLEKQNDFLNGLMQKILETKVTDIQNHTLPISHSSPFDTGEHTVRPLPLSHNEINNITSPDFLSGWGNQNFDDGIINLKGGNSITWQLNKPWEDPGYSAISKYEDLTAFVETSSFVDVNVPGQYKVIYTLKHPSSEDVLDSVERSVHVKNSIKKPVTGKSSPFGTRVETVRLSPFSDNQMNNIKSKGTDRVVIENINNVPIKSSPHLQIGENEVNNNYNLPKDGNLHILMHVDGSGSSISQLRETLEVMKNSLLKNALLPYYKNDESLYNNRVRIIDDYGERTLRFFADAAKKKNVLALVFQDEAQPTYHNSNFNTKPEVNYIDDLNELKDSFTDFAGLYRGIMFQVDRGKTFAKSFKQFVQNAWRGEGYLALEGNNLKPYYWLQNSNHIRNLDGIVFSDEYHVNSEIDSAKLFNLIMEATSKVGLNLRSNPNQNMVSKNPEAKIPPGFRSWTNKDGIKIFARLIQIHKDRIKILRSDGREFVAEISAFSKEDQEFVKKIKENQANNQARPPQVPLVNKPKPIPVNRPNPRFNDYPKGLHDRTWTDKGGNKIQAYVWGYVPEADAICLVKNTPNGPSILYPKISEMAFSAADENYLKAFTDWRESVLRPYREKLPEMVRIPAGKFLMGSPPFEEGRKSDETQHEVTISNDFLMGKYKVTQGEWLSVMGNTIDAQSFRVGIIKTPKVLNGPWYPDYKRISGSVLKDFVGKFYEKTPVSAWYGYARQYCDKLTEIHRQNGLIGKDIVFRLPTEAEWEYALRAGTTTAYFWGNNRSDGKLFGLNYSSSSNQLPDNVGSFGKANPWGLFDLCFSSEFILDKPRNYSQGGAAFNRNKIDPIGIIPSIPKLRESGGGWVIRRDNSRLGSSSSLTLPSGVGYVKRGSRRSGERPETGMATFRIVLAKPIK